MIEREEIKKRCLDFIEWGEINTEVARAFLLLVNDAMPSPFAMTPPCKNYLWSDLVSLLGKSLRQVERDIEKLEEKGLIFISRKMEGPTGKRGGRYVLLSISFPRLQGEIDGAT